MATVVLLPALARAQFDRQECALEIIKRDTPSVNSASKFHLFAGSSNFTDKAASIETFRSLGVIDQAATNTVFYFTLQKAALSIKINGVQVQHLAAFGFCADEARTRCSSFQGYFTRPVATYEFAALLQGRFHTGNERLVVGNCNKQAAFYEKASNTV